jgi:endonuclease-3
MNKESVVKIIKIFDDIYPDAQCTLNFETPLELLVATQLAAQCTDERVNKVTVDLFKKYKTPKDYAGSNIKDLENDIKSTGFFRNKAKNIKAACQMIMDKYNGNVPGNMEDLLLLPGVGRKTANVILGSIFNIPGIIVDTHAGRLSRRIGMTKHEDPEKVEKDLMKTIPKDSWSKFCHQLVAHGRRICKARKPLCSVCEINEQCDYFSKI